MNKVENHTQDVTAVITAMTNDEKPFLLETMRAVLSDPCIGQVVLCIDETNNWFDTLIGSLIKDPRLTIARMPMMTIGAVRNKALDHVQKTWLAYCDGDDVWCKGKTMLQRAYAERTGASFIGAGHYLMDEASTICAYGLSRFIPMPSSWLVRTEIMKRYPFDEQMQQGSDGEWWVLTSKFVPKVKCPEILLRYRIRSSSVSSGTPSKSRKLKLLHLSKIPLVKSCILFASHCLWLVTRHQPYKWMNKWSKSYEQRAIEHSSVNNNI